MVDVAAAAGVSRQTLYNEFGSKDGLARALVRREADAYLAGVDRALRRPQRTPATGWWRPRSGRPRRPRGNALVRAMLTGCWAERLPAPGLAAVPSTSAVPAQRRADGPLPSPADFVALVRDRAVAALAVPGAETAEVTRSCELVVRLGLSCVVAPPAEGGAAELVRAALGPARRHGL